MKHLDLFSGIGGFSLAADRVFGEVEHTFVEIDPFCQAVLKKHWPKSKIYEDIREFASYAEREGWSGESRDTTRQRGLRGGTREDEEPFLLTGGFPCQPFSHAGRRRGTEDDRYLWPAMFDIIQITRPRWVVAENVRGLVTWNDGLVLETVCADLEGEGYEVQPFIIPACAVGAPHRRDRVWIVAHSLHDRQGNEKQTVTESQDKIPGKHREKDGSAREFKRANSDGENVRPASDSARKRGERERVSVQPRRSRKEGADVDWTRDWREVAFATCDDGMDDGLPRGVGGLPHSFAKWRKEALKAYGNAIVPQVATEIFRAIRATM